MALTDVPLTFWFVIGAYCLVRLTECGARPLRMAGWSLALGLAIGAAWNTKYNGWMLAAIAATTWIILATRDWVLRSAARRQSRDDSFVPRPIGLAIAFSALVAVVCFIPWYRHVELTYDGGYEAVVRNHLRYAGGLGEWPARAHRLMISLSAFRHYGWLATLLAATTGVGILLAQLRNRSSADGPNLFVATGVAIAGLAAAVALGCDAVLFFLAAAAIVPALVWGRWPDVLFAVWAGAFLVLTPFYHPYTRLLVPALPAVIGLALGLVTQALGLVNEAPGERQSDERSGSGATQVSRRFLAAGCAGALLTALLWHPLGWLPGRHLWQRWSTTDSYRALGDAVEEAKLPRDAMVLCLGVPAMTLYIEREWSPIEFVPFQKVLARVSPDRDCYLAVDSWGAYGENHRLALASLRERLSCLEPITVVPNDLNLATLLDYLEPADLEAHLSRERPALHVQEVVFPADLNQPYAELIVLYRIDRGCLTARQLD